MDNIEYLDPSKINGLNLYSYCLNNPIMYCDPSGHSALLIGLLVGAFALGVGASVVGQGVSHGWDEINYWQVGLDGLISLGTTALSFTGIPAWGMAIIGAGAGLAQYAMDAEFHDKQMSWLEGVTSTMTGGVFGYAGGAGVRNASEIGKKMVGLSDDGVRAVSAITKAANKYAANQISKKGMQATLNLFGRTAFDAVQNAIPGTIRHLMITGFTSGIWLTALNTGVSYGLNYLYNLVGWC